MGHNFTALRTKETPRVYGAFRLLMDWSLLLHIVCLAKQRGTSCVAGKAFRAGRRSIRTHVFLVCIFVLETRTIYYGSKTANFEEDR